MHPIPMALMGLLLLQEDREELRAKLWREDLAHLEEKLPELHANLFFKIPAGQWKEEVQAVREKIVPGLSTHAFVVEITKLVAAVGDTQCRVHRPLMSLPVIPLRLYWFPDGIYVIGHPRRMDRFMGAKLVKVAGRPVEAAARALAPFLPHENEEEFKKEVVRFLLSPPILKAGGLLARKGKVLHGFEDPAGKTFEAELSPLEFRDLGKVRWAFPMRKRPLYTERQGEPFWFRWLPVEKALYLKFNRGTDAGGFEKMLESMWKAVEGKACRRLIVDLRDNSGGDSRVMEPLLRELGGKGRFGRKGTLFAIIGRGTGSSAVLNALSLRRKGAVLVGGRTSGKPDRSGDPGVFHLPNSGLRITYAKKYLRPLPGDPPSLVPDREIPFRSGDWFAGRDAWLEAALEN